MEFLNTHGLSYFWNRVKTYVDRQVASSGGGSNDKGYSLEEQVDGLWVDGKPIYRKTVICQTGSDSQDGVWVPAGFVIENLDYLINFESTLKTKVNSITPLPFTDATNLITVAYFFNSGGKNGFYTYMKNVSGNYYQGRTFYITAWYTKSTDVATKDVPQIVSSALSQPSIFLPSTASTSGVIEI